MTPEMETNTKVWHYITKVADMWLMGVCLFEMLNFDKPIDEKLAITQSIEYVKQKQRNREFRFHKRVADVL
jgi:hypothetical protein